MRTATVYNFLLEANIMASIAILLMAFVRKFFRKQLGNRAIRYGWLLVAIRLLLPISLPNPWISEIRPAYLNDAGIRPIAGQIKIRLQDALAEGAWWARYNFGETSILSNSMDSARDRIYDGISAARLMKFYLAGVAVVLLWFIISNAIFRRKMRVGRIEPISGTLREKYENLCRTRKVKPVPVYYTDPLASACLVGVFRPYIVMPLTAAPDEAIQVLSHEICHLKGRDNIWSLVRLICCAVHWFNPLVWLAAWMSRTDGELACDDRVISVMNDDEKRDYASVLVLSASRRNSPGILTMATGMTMTGKCLKDRVDGIIHSGGVKRGAALAFALAASMCLVGAFATSEVQKVWGPISVPTVDRESAWTTDAEMLKHYQSAPEDLNAYGTGLWESSYVRESEIGTGFHLTEIEEGKWMMTDGIEALVLIFDQDGKLKQLSNAQSHYNNAVWLETSDKNNPADSVMGSPELEKMYDYLSGFLMQFAPDLYHDVVAYTVDDQYVLEDDTVFVEFTQRAFDEEETEMKLCQIEIEMEPEFRVVRFYRFGEDEDTSFLGNG